MDLDSALFSVALFGNLLQSASAGTASAAMVTAMQAENTTRCKVIVNPPFK
jgi:hypothetical protein